MATPSTASPTAHQIRLYLPRETVARLLDLQARAVEHGYRKPSYSTLIQAAVTKLDPADIVGLIEGSGL